MKFQQILAAGGIVAGLGGVALLPIAGGATPGASLTGHASCIATPDDSGIVIDWTVTNEHGGIDHVTALKVTGGLASLEDASQPVGGYSVARQVIAGSSTGTVTLTIANVWSDATSTSTASVSLPKGC